MSHRIFTADSTGKTFAWDGELPMIEWRSLPSEAGLYAVFHNTRAVYVGRSKSIYRRWQNGMWLYAGKWDHIPETELSIRWIVMNECPTREQEQFLINELRPFANRQMA
mgnify:FL=1